MYMDDIKLFGKNEKERDGIWHRKMRHATSNNEKRKRHLTERTDLLNQEKIRTLGEKETYEYLGILEADTIKQAEIKENFLKRVSLENRKTTRNRTI